MGIFWTTTEVKNDIATGTHYETVEAETKNEATEKVTAGLQDKGWTEIDPVFVREGRKYS
ncbi:hypothetical protein ACFCV8_08160 [Streptomyces sp. NPDC056347]|uniref:hypothetical protein n=1 Tax=Streptomyces sp. NPDC056347 TaxID=3345790 RepID=UPI0035DF2835